VFEKEELLKQGFWSAKGPYNDTVISSRIRLARNIPSVPFPDNMNGDEPDIIIGIARSFQGNSSFSGSTLVILDSLSVDEKRLLREMNLITDEMEKSLNSAVIINETENFSILVNEEDHFRIQVIRPGLQLSAAYETADKVDEELNHQAPYAFSSATGYLAACPSNVGTALKASVLLHLPVLTMMKRMPEIADSIRKERVELRGTGGSGSKTMGCIYQVSNRISLGLSEVDIIETLDGLVSKIIDMEDDARDEYIRLHRAEAEDKIFRSLGAVKFARRISYAESMEHLSNIRLGLILGLVRAVDLPFIQTIMVNIQQAHLQNIYHRRFENIIETEEYRGEYLRMNFNALESV